MNAKEYLRSIKLSAEDQELLREFKVYTIEALIIHVYCTLFTPAVTSIHIATLVDHLEKSIRKQASLLKNKRLKDLKNKDKNSKISNEYPVTEYIFGSSRYGRSEDKDSTTFVVKDSNILTDRSKHITNDIIKYVFGPSEEVKEKGKNKGRKIRQFPIGIALVELLEVWDLIVIKTENPEGAKSVKKHGQYYAQKPIPVECKFDISKLPVMFNLLMVCPPKDWYADEDKTYPTSSSFMSLF